MERIDFDDIHVDESKGIIRYEEIKIFYAINNHSIRNFQGNAKKSVWLMNV